MTTSLSRAVGLAGAVMMGLGSILGTGVFVSLGLTAGLTGASMLLALLLAGLLAVCNGLSSAQLAAAHPVSGGTYEYGYRFLTPPIGFLAGWLFVCAKTASAATAAIGFGGYFVELMGIAGIEPWQVGLGVVAITVAIALFGISRSNAVNIAIVTVTVSTLGLYVLTLAPRASVEQMQPIWNGAALGRTPLGGFLEAMALIFVAYTGYGRIATLGEEVKNPATNIPRAIVWTLGLSFLLYLTVAFISLGTAGPNAYYEATITTKAPLEAIAKNAGHPLLAKALTIGAMSAMLGVLLNLVLGISRVILAMARKDDLPRFFTRISERRRAPSWAIAATGCIIGMLVAFGDMEQHWSFSAFTVLVYYAITNAAALQLPPEERRYSRALAWIGLAGCLGLSVWVDQRALTAGVAILVVGLFWRAIYRRLALKQ